MTFQNNGRPQAGGRQGAFGSAQLSGLKHLNATPVLVERQQAGAQRDSLSWPTERARQLSTRAATIAFNLARQEATRALKVSDAAERRELLSASATLKAWSSRLEREARR